MREEYKNWINQAEADFRKAKILLDNNEFDGVAFFSQQTAEKSLKSVVIKNMANL